MHQSNRTFVPILKTAWRHQAEFDINANQAQKLHISLRRWVIILSVAATLLAISTEVVATRFERPLLERSLQIALILVPIIGSTILAFANKFEQGQRWLTLRAGAEEIKKEIYFYRTLRQNDKDRDQWLSRRLADIQRDAFEAVDEELVLTPYPGDLPPYYSPDDETSDPGFNDLTPDKYIRYRLDDQLDWHTKRMKEMQRERFRLQILIFAFGAGGTFLAAIGLNVWVALTASLAAALTAWLELRQNETIIKNYSQIVLELTIIRDHWQSLEPEDRTLSEFFDLVTATEGVLWSQHNMFVSEMRQTIATLQDKYEASLAQETTGEKGFLLEEPATGDDMAPARRPSWEITDDFLDGPDDEPDGLRERVEGVEKDPPAGTNGSSPRPTPAKGAPHAFVVMPFGQKTGFTGNLIDFDAIYHRLIGPALIEAGFKPFRADEETVSGDILTDMFQELLLADLVIADLSIDNANVFYELGVRHSMRKRGVIHIQAGRDYMPFDIFNVRTIPYTCGPDGKPDPAHLEKDKQAIAKVAQDTWASDEERVHSPIFNLLDGLVEPDRKSLQTPLARGYWREHYEWEERVRIAQRRKRVGDILLLTEEVRNPIIKEEAIGEAGQALKSLGCHRLALEQYQRGLQINPNNIEFRRQEAFFLGRLKRADEAIVKLEWLIEYHDRDGAAIAFLGRLYKDMFVDEWLALETEEARLQAAYEASYLLKRAIDTYLRAYSLDQNDEYPGVNALSLSLLFVHLVESVAGQDEAGPEVEALKSQLPSLTGSVQFSLAQAARQRRNDFWVFASLGDLAVMTADRPAEAARAYRRALAIGGKNRFNIVSVLSQLRLLEKLAFRPTHVKTGVEVLETALSKLTPAAQSLAEESEAQSPADVFFFAGHMIDAKDRPEPRFPPAMEPEARQKIEAVLDRLQADSNDMALVPGAACGGDILFIEACLARKVKVEVYLPFAPEKFVETSVSYPKEEENNWVERFHAIRLDPNVTIHLQPDRVGPVPAGDDPFERNNRWALYSAMGYAIERMQFIVLWDGRGGDGPGGTRHLVEEANHLGGVVTHIDTRKFDYWQARSQVNPQALSH